MRVRQRIASVPPRLRFAVFLGTTLLITAAMTTLAYTLYNVSGAAQLDLSRPGYKQALKEVDKGSDDVYSYSSSGPLDASSLKDFKTKFDALTSKTRGYSAFDSSALSDEQLNLNTDTSSSIGPQ